MIRLNSVRGPLTLALTSKRDQPETRGDRRSSSRRGNTNTFRRDGRWRKLMTRSADALHLDLEWIKVMAPFTSDDFSLSLCCALPLGRFASDLGIKSKVGLDDRALELIPKVARLFPASTSTSYIRANNIVKVFGLNTDLEPFDFPNTLNRPWSHQTYPYLSPHHLPINHDQPWPTLPTVDNSKTSSLETRTCVKTSSPSPAPSPTFT